MQERIGRVRSSTVIAAVLALVISSVAAGAAGDFLVLGDSNSSGSAQTTLSNSGLGAAFTLRTTNTSTNATGIFGWSSSTAANVTRGVYGRADGANSYGVYAANLGSAGSGAAVFADGGSNDAIVAISDGGDGIVAESGTCTGFLCGRTGVVGVGFGFAGGVSGEGPLGVIGFDSTAGSGFGLITPDDASIGGDLTVGTCTGCTTALLGTNGGSSSLQQGDAVTATGAAADAEGNVLITVEKAGKGDTVFGIVSAAVRGVQSAVNEKAFTAYKDSGTTVAAGGKLRIITGGIVTFAAADASGGAIAVGDSLAASAEAGKLTKADASAPAFGVALGTLADGRVVVFIK
jgi:hypothetical protein